MKKILVSATFLILFVVWFYIDDSRVDNSWQVNIISSDSSVEGSRPPKEIGHTAHTNSSEASTIQMDDASAPHQPDSYDGWPSELS